MAEITKDNIVLSPFPKIDIPNCDLWALLERTCTENATKTALVDPIENRTFTFKELHDVVEVIAGNLHSLGYSPKTYACIFMPNCIEYILTEFAIWRLGGTVMLVNSLQTKDELNKVLIDLKPEFLFCNESTVGRALSASYGTHIKKIVSKTGHSGCVTFSSLIKPCFNIPPHPVLHPKDAVGIIMFSSGTTGVAKGVELAHHSFVEEVHVFRYALNGSESFKGGGVIYQPLSHAYGVLLVMSYLFAGNRVIVMQQFNLERYIAMVSKYKIKIMFFVPPIAVNFCKSDLAKKYELGHVKLISTGAAALSPVLEKEMGRIMGKNVKINQGFGMTETAGGCIRTPNFDISVKCPQGSVGWPLSNTQAKIVDLSTGASLGPNKSGELCVKCNYMMKGYLGNHEATTRTIDKDGWLHTGDIAYFDKNGSFFVIDRLKELIKYKGYQVAPNELETVLLSHKTVADVGVSAVPDLEAGELPVAWVVKKQGTTLSKEDLQKYVNDKVAPYKRLRGGIRFVQSIPKSPTGKILRRKIKEAEMSKTSKL